jgi:hypothetical protein
MLTGFLVKKLMSAEVPTCLDLNCLWPRLQKSDHITCTVDSISSNTLLYSHVQQFPKSIELQAKWFDLTTKVSCTARKMPSALVIRKVNNLCKSSLSYIVDIPV